MNVADEFVISRFQERFGGDFFDSAEAAIAAAAELYRPGDAFYVGKVEHLAAPVIDADGVADLLWEGVMDAVEENMADQGGEAAEGYPREEIAVGVKEDVCGKMAALLSDALPQPAFYLVTGVTKHQL
jgi:hypothetical protein